ncbi:MAG: inositol monophosphatase [Xanthomonadales bacterium]|nr:inositol monophosphatase [Xanthomonadales bacterium]NIX12662.1 inositol monophosphatase [Xanthomonadales bacterium]
MAHPAINVAVKAARQAGELMRRQLQQVDSIPVTRKARHDYVSDVDRACEAEIVREISRFYPDHAFLGEEGGRRGEGEIVWVVDPLDGTSNYLHGIPHFAVSIAQQVNGRTEHAVVFDPVRDEMYTASRGGGAFLNQQRIRVSARPGLEGAILATAFPFRYRQHMKTYMHIFNRLWDQVEDVRRAGTASLDLAYVAAGRVDGFFEIGLKPWDVAAGTLLVREAGGVVTDFAGNDRVEESDSVMAAPFKVMTQMRRIIEPRWTARSRD